MNTELTDEWPKLSVDLIDTHAPDRCQACGGPAASLWREHDRRDKPTHVVVPLCQCCADRLIEDHPRLCSRLRSHEPAPGVMPICLDCTRRDGVSCTSPVAIFNGGTGMALTMPQPTRAFVDYAGKSKGLLGKQTIYNGPVTACASKETIRQ